MAGEAPNMEAIVQAIGPAACRTTAEIAELSGLTRKQVGMACGKLVMRDLIERIEVGCFRLTPNGKDIVSGAAKLDPNPRKPLNCARVPRTTTLRQRAWAAMRLQKRFTVADIATLAANERDKQPEHHLAKWFSYLVRAGYLAALPRRVPTSAPTSNGLKCWTLLRDTGDIVPLVRADGSWHDHNTGATGAGGAPCSR